MLIGKGLWPLAQRWAEAIDQTSTDFAQLTPRSTDDALLALAPRMKAVTVLYQNEVAAALDVPEACAVAVSQTQWWVGGSTGVLHAGFDADASAQLASAPSNAPPHWDNHWQIRPSP